MGSGNWSSANWQSYSTNHISGQSAANIYTSRRMVDTYDPAKIAMRESRDNADHPESTPIIVGLDVTGSMSSILESVANKIGDLVQGIYDKKPVSDPQVMFAGIGDLNCDHAPLQVTQFESDIRIAEQIKDIYLEQGGGGNDSESYPAIWEFANRKIVTDAFEKRGKKGFIFTMGDDGCPKKLFKRQIEHFLGINVSEDLSVAELADEVSRKWDIYHLCLAQGGTHSDEDYRRWQQVLGERAILVTDYNCIPEIIISILQSVAGESLDDIVKGWDGSTGLVVKTAIGNLTSIRPKIASVVTL